jgi:hypothetical protein
VTERRAEAIDLLSVDHPFSRFSVNRSDPTAPKIDGDLRRP